MANTRAKGAVQATGNRSISGRAIGAVQIADILLPVFGRARKGIAGGKIITETGDYKAIAGGTLPGWRPNRLEEIR